MVGFVEICYVSSFWVEHILFLVDCRDGNEIMGNSGRGNSGTVEGIAIEGIKEEGG